MSKELIASKKKSESLARDPAELDSSMGYVSVTELRNVFTHRIRDLDTVIWPREGRMPYRDEMMDFYITTMVELMQKAQRNYEQFCKRSAPMTTRPAAPRDPAFEGAVDAARASLDARKAKIEKWTR